jgi:hypothetical protein
MAYRKVYPRGARKVQSGANTELPVTLPVHPVQRDTAPCVRDACTRAYVFPQGRRAPVTSAALNNNAPSVEFLRSADECPDDRRYMINRSF